MVGVTAMKGQAGGRAVGAGEGWRLYLGVAGVVVARVGGVLAALVLNLVMARLMGPGEMGLALMAMSAASVGAVIAAGGLEGGAVRFLPAYLATGREAAARAYLRLTGRGVWLIGAGVLILVAIATAVLPPVPSGTFILALLGAVLLAVVRVQASHCLGFGRPVAADLPVQFLRPGFLMIAVAAAGFLAPPLMAERVMALFVITLALVAVIQAVLARKTTRSLARGPRDWSGAREWVSVGVQLGLAGLFIGFGRDIAILCAGAVLPAEDVARLGVALRIAGFVKFGMIAVNQAFMPRLSAAMARGDQPAVDHAIALSNHLKFWPMLAAVILIHLLAAPIMGVFGPEFVAAAPVLTLLLVEPVVAAIFGPGSSVVSFGRRKHLVLPVALASSAILAGGVVIGGHVGGFRVPPLASSRPGSSGPQPSPSLRARNSAGASPSSARCSRPFVRGQGRWAGTGRAKGSDMQVDPQKVLVGVPALDEEDAIAPCLRSLLEGEDMRDVSIVVADGGSRDRTREIVRELAREWPNLRLIDNPGRLQSAAMNRIAELEAAPAHEILVRCDAHAIYPPGYVARVVRALEARDAASVVVPMDAYGETCFARAAAWVVDTPLGNGGSAHRGGGRSGFVDHGHHAGMRLSWFRKVGGYDPKFSHNEDAELDHRLTSAGGRIWLESEARLAYRMRDTMPALARQYWRYGQGRARTVMKHRMRPRLRQLLPVWNLVFLVACFALAPVFPAALAGPSAYALVLVATGLVAAVSMRAPCGLLAGVALAAMHLPWGAGFLTGILRGALAAGRGLPRRRPEGRVAP